jgi:Type II secretion system (T2SS), protein E, N-terminal domain
MLRLGDLLVSRGLITSEQLADALFAQRQFGGRLGTNLVELGFVSDDQLALCLSQQLAVPFAKPDALASIPRDVIARLPAAVAAKYRAVPLRYEVGELHLGMADPQNFAKLDEINFALGIRVRPYVVTEVALNYALERYYGLPREARLMQAAAAGMRDLHAPAPPRPASARGPDQGAGGTGARSTRLSGARPALPVFDPVYEGNVIDELAAVMSAEDLVQVLFRYFSDLFVEVIILAITPGRATALRAGSRTRHCETRQTATLSLSDGTLLRAVIGKPQIIHQLAVADPEVIRLCASFAVPTSNVAFISLFDGETPAFAVIGQGRDERYLQQAFGGLKGFVNKAGQALRIVALRNDILAA